MRRGELHLPGHYRCSPSARPLCFRTDGAGFARALAAQYGVWAKVGGASRDKLMKFVQTAFEASIYVSPASPGLTIEEIYEAGDLGLPRKASFDAVRRLEMEPLSHFRDMSRPGRSFAPAVAVERCNRTPEPRNEKAFESCTLLRRLARVSTRAWRPESSERAGNSGKAEAPVNTTQVAITAPIRRCPV